MSYMLDAALALAGDGFSLFPAEPRGKVPIVANGFHSATREPGQISKWWTRTPDANIAAAIPPGHMVIDWDSYKPAGERTMSTLVDALGELPETLTCETGGGGMHLWFTVSDGDYRAPGGGVDLRLAGKGYVITPPSVHRSGRGYVWHDESMPVAPLPQPWIDHLSRRSVVPGRRIPLPAPGDVTTAAWLAQLPAGAPDEAMRVAVGLSKLAEDMRAAAHNTALGRVYHCVMLGAEGHPGVHWAVGKVLIAFRDEMKRRQYEGLPRAVDDREAATEFERLLAGAVERAGGDQ